MAPVKLNHLNIRRFLSPLRRASKPYARSFKDFTSFRSISALRELVASNFHRSRQQGNDARIRYLVSDRGSSAPLSKTGSKDPVFKSQHPVPYLDPPISSLGMKVQEDVSSGKLDPATAFKHFVGTGKANLEVARICLCGFRKWLSSFRRHERLTPIQKVNIGTIVLDWLWEDDKRWEGGLDSVVLIEELCYFLTAEGRESYALAWMKAEVPSDVTPRRGWRGAVLRGLVRAQLLLNQNNVADPAIHLFCDFKQDVEHLRRTLKSKTVPYMDTPTFPALIELETQLAGGLYFRTSNSAYKRFVEEYNTFPFKDDRGLPKAGLALYTPGKPNPNPGLSYMQSRFKDRFFAEIKGDLPSSMAGKRKFCLFLGDLARILHTLERKTDARWIKSCRDQLFSEEEVQQHEAYRPYVDGRFKPPNAHWVTKDGQRCAVFDNADA